MQIDQENKEGCQKLMPTDLCRYSGGFRNNNISGHVTCVIRVSGYGVIPVLAYQISLRVQQAVGRPSDVAVL